MSALYYKDLIVWHKSMDLVTEIYGLVKLLPKEELYSLSDQMRRSAVSIPSNIAEGQQRKSNKEFVNFLSFARGSLAELETQLLICVRLEYFNYESIDKSMNLCKEIGKMINALMNKTESK